MSNPPSPTLHDATALLRRLLAVAVVSDDADAEAVLDALNALDVLTRRVREL